MMNIPWGQPATLIDLDGETQGIGSMLEWVMYFLLLRPFAKEQARILLARPVFREGGETRTSILNPDESERVVERLNAEREAAR
jgi:hypothetical protein